MAGERRNLFKKTGIKKKSAKYKRKHQRPQGGQLAHWKLPRKKKENVDDER